MSGLADAPAPDFAAELVRRATDGGADAAQVTTVDVDRFEIDFSERKVDLLRSTANETTTILVLRGGKRGSATLNGRDEEAVEAALRSALLAAEAGLADPANAVADALSLPPRRHGAEAPDRDAMIATVLAYVGELNTRYPLIRTRNSTYTFFAKDTAFANSLGVQQQQRRAWYQFGAMFSAKEGARATSFNYSGAASYAPFERLLAVGTVGRLIEETLRSFDARPVPEKFVGDVILTPDCVYHLIFVLARALGGYELLAGTSPYRDKASEPIASPLFSLLNRPLAADFPEGSDFDGFGIPTVNVDIVKDGRLENFLVDFYIARKLGLPQTAGVWNFVVPPRRPQPRRHCRRHRARHHPIALFRRQSKQQPRIQRRREELVLHRGRRNPPRPERDDGHRQPAGFVAEYSGGFARTGQFRRPRLSVSGRVRGDDLGEMSGTTRLSVDFFSDKAARSGRGLDH
jgi:PmbA protein